MHLLRTCSVLISFLVFANGAVRFTNLKCIEYEPALVTLETCNLKLLQRGVVGMNIYIKFHRYPVTDIMINLSLHKRANGYRPFLYNVSADFCNFMKRPKKYPLLKIFFDALAKDSNINHTCPFNHDIILHNWVLKEYDFRFLPLPSGEYVFKLKIGVSSDWKADINGYFAVRDLF